MKNGPLHLIMLLALSLAGNSLYAQMTLTRLGVPEGGLINAVNNLGNTVFAGTAGLYRSNDAGQSWQQMNLLSDSSTQVVDIITTDNNLVFAVAQTFFSSNMYMSADIGDNWSQLPILQARSAAKTSTHLVVATTDGYIYRSDLSGQSWAAVDSFAGVLLNCIVADGDTLYLGTQSSGVYRSVDNGATWALYGTGIGSNNVTHLVKYHQQLYAATFDNNIWMLHNSTNTWQMMTNAGIGCHYILSLRTINDKLYTVGNGGSGIAVYDSASNYWNLLPQPLGFQQVWDMCLANGKLYAASTLGLFVSADNGQSWVNSHNGMAASLMSSIATNGQNLVASSKYRVYKSGSTVYNWSLFPYSSDSISNFYPGQVFYFGDTVVTSYTGFDAGIPPSILLTTDDGQDWTNISTGLGSSSSTYDLTVKNGRILAGFLNSSNVYKVYYSDNRGTTWNPTNFTDTGYVKIVDGGALLFAHSSGHVNNYISSDGGLTWSISQTPPYASKWPTLMAGAYLQGKIFIGSDLSGVVFSSDNGATWSAPGPDGGVNDIFELDGKIYAHNAGNIRALDSTNQWQLVFSLNQNVGLGKGAIMGNAYYIPSFGQGVYRFAGGALGTGIAPATSPVNCSVFPNPSNKQMFVSSPFDVKELILVDMQGKIALHRGALQGNTQTIDVSHISAGDYLLQIVTANGMVAKPVIVTK